MPGDTPRPFIYSPPPAGPLPVIHADDHILVIDKPSGLLTVPGNRPERADCLEARARADFPTARIIHRLDMDTSGVIVLALTAHAQAHIGKQFEKRQTSKSYIARVQGEMTQSSGRVDQPLITDWPNRPRQMICHERGRRAVTDWEVLDIADGVSRVRLAPLTGRSHQLRVHMLHLGHPILGDNLYAPPDALAASDRLCLHARELGFRHPDGGAPVSFESRPPF
ncbi:RNA pseudouridine synthase [Maricaulis sp. W15]|uniref:RluA family pseudouridine synthase n=1 Tax=Maricaulis sp. W15 TaxID=1772333 RepID=UPI0009490BB4|nr:RluA family pseudouridine synthase [Maricaulis sp. W15]OLF80662.1 RNA pseudouridine synthase [Maricaulis sp. W15]